MSENELQKQEIKEFIEKTVDESVDKAFKKYGKRSGFSLFSLRKLISLFILAALIGTGVYWYNRYIADDKVASIENHDLTLKNNGIFGFTVADFEEVILGEATRQRLLIVEEQEVYVNTTITDTGLFNLGVFNKKQALTIHGTGQYTIDLTQINVNDISLDEGTYELTIRIPHAVLHQTSFDPEKTEIGDSQNGWLAFGSIKLDMEQQKEFETTTNEKLEEKLSEKERLEEADRFAKLSAYETYQPIVKTISPAYKVIIEFK